MKQSHNLDKDLYRVSQRRSIFIQSQRKVCIHNIGVGYHAGSFGGRYSRTYSGFSNYNSVQIGSVVFMQGSTIACVFKGIHYPSGLVKMCKSIMKAQQHVLDGMNLMLRLT